MIRAEANPPRIVVELPGREPYIEWDRARCLQLINEMFNAAKMFYSEELEKVSFNIRG